MLLHTSIASNKIYQASREQTGREGVASDFVGAEPAVRAVECKTDDERQFL